ncbi:TPA: LOW QUALITY PROTEIN: hypothetical protein N0F65_011736 [Lagenidium giganteum]|uniref:PX domain-containing protein n=1 Tax=Lagenidium giganteum TaxID=4803 RepID=A0AAV2YHJ2_9STRA|nr:TPA: LOW QUALITY PROTEIN: hypothetical protein N0F65_011736 [Lagenidium giganteum]
MQQRAVPCTAHGPSQTKPRSPAVGNSRRRGHFPNAANTPRVLHRRRSCQMSGRKMLMLESRQTRFKPVAASTPAVAKASSVAGVSSRQCLVPELRVGATLTALGALRLDNQLDDPMTLLDMETMPRLAVRRSGKRATKTQRKLQKYQALAKTAQQLNRMSSFLLHSVTPREAFAFRTYTMDAPHSSGVTSSSYIEYDVVVENYRTGMVWQVARRYSTFAFLRTELVRLFQTPHCHYCANVASQLRELDAVFPGKRLWGSKSAATTAARSKAFSAYIEGLLALAAQPFALNCRLVSVGLVPRLRGFLTSDGVRFKGIPGAQSCGYEVPSMLRELCVARNAVDHVTLATIAEVASVYSAVDEEDDVDDSDEAQPQDDENEDNQCSACDDEARRGSTLNNTLAIYFVPGEARRWRAFMIVGATGCAFSVEIDAANWVNDLKDEIASKQNLDFAASKLELFLAKKDGTWLTEDATQCAYDTNDLTHLNVLDARLKDVGLGTKRLFITDAMAEPRLCLLPGLPQFGKSTIALQLVEWIEKDPNVGNTKCWYHDLQATGPRDLWQHLGRVFHSRSVYYAKSFVEMLRTYTATDQKLLLILDEMHYLFAENETTLHSGFVKADHIIKTTSFSAGQMSKLLMEPYYPFLQSLRSELMQYSRGAPGALVSMMNYTIESGEWALEWNEWEQWFTVNARFFLYNLKAVETYCRLEGNNERKRHQLVRPLLRLGIVTEGANGKLSRKNTTMKLVCAIVGAASSVFSVEIGDAKWIDDLKDAITTKQHFDFAASKLELFLAKKDGVWLTENEARCVKKTDGLKHLHAVHVQLRDSGLSDTELQLRVAKHDIEAGHGPVNVLVVVPATQQPRDTPGNGAAAETKKSNKLTKRQLQIEFNGPVCRGSYAVPVSTIAAFRQLKRAFTTDSASENRLYLLVGPRFFGKSTIALQLVERMERDPNLGNVMCVYYELGADDMKSGLFRRRMGNAFEAQVTRDVNALAGLLLRCACGEQKTLLVLDGLHNLSIQNGLASGIMCLLRAWMHSSYCHGFLGIGCYEMMDYVRGDNFLSHIKADRIIKMIPFSAAQMSTFFTSIEPQYSFSQSLRSGLMQYSRGAPGLFGALVRCTIESGMYALEWREWEAWFMVHNRFPLYMLHCSPLENDLKKNLSDLTALQRDALHYIMEHDGELTAETIQAYCGLDGSGSDKRRQLVDPLLSFGIVMEGTTGEIMIVSEMMYQACVEALPVREIGEEVVAYNPMELLCSALRHFNCDTLSIHAKRNPLKIESTFHLALLPTVQAILEKNPVGNRSKVMTAKSPSRFDLLIDHDCKIAFELKSNQSDEAQIRATVKKADDYRQQYYVDYMIVVMFVPNGQRVDEMYRVVEFPNVHVVYVWFAPSCDRFRLRFQAEGGKIKQRPVRNRSSIERHESSAPVAETIEIL